MKQAAADRISRSAGRLTAGPDSRLRPVLAATRLGVSVNAGLGAASIELEVAPDDTFIEPPPSTESQAPSTKIRLAPEFVAVEDDQV